MPEVLTDAQLATMQAYYDTGAGGWPGTEVEERYSDDARTLIAEVRRLRAVLEEIRTRCLGQVCPDYDVCEHPWCASSYAAWALADAALEELVRGERDGPSVRVNVPRPVDAERVPEGAV